MNTTYSEQINAIRMAITAINDMQNPDQRHPRWERTCASLNDAASTIAALNLTKDLLKEPDQSREEYWEKLQDLASAHFTSNSVEEENELKETILAMSYDKTVFDYNEVVVKHEPALTPQQREIIKSVAEFLLKEEKDAIVRDIYDRKLLHSHDEFLSRDHTTQKEFLEQNNLTNHRYYEALVLAALVN